MLKIHTLPLGSYQTNCYILHEETSKSCVIIDPGYQAEDLLLQLRQLGLTLDAILLTHGHFDHVGAVKTLAMETDCKVYIHSEEQTMPPQFTAGPLYFTHTYAGGETLELSGLSFRVLHTPGHTPGSVCLICQNALFSGDTLFAGSCGRTDLPGGNWSQIRQSLGMLSALEGDFGVYPGHGEPTTLALERQYNPYIQ